MKRKLYLGDGENDLMEKDTMIEMRYMAVEEARPGSRSDL